MENREIVYMGALLHDIGKFTYRSQKTKAGDNHEKLGEELIREYLTTKIDAFASSSEDILQASLRGKGKVWRADCIVAAEREEQKSSETRRPLVSIFKRINIRLGDAPNNIYFHNPNPLEIYKNIDVEPVLEIKNNQAVEDWDVENSDMIDLHKASYVKFLDELRLFRNGRFQDSAASLTTLYSFLWKYTSNICSAGYLSYPDISLFDHSRNVAAIALCLEEGDNDAECLLQKGDISGIQKFIYQEIDDTNQASKRLRGRSFYIKLLTDALSSYITRELNLFESSVFFNSGGHFVIIAPNNKQNREKVAQLEKKINLMLLEMFGPILQLVMVNIIDTAENVMSNFNDVSDKLQATLLNAKKHKSFSILKDIINYEASEKHNIDFAEIGGTIPYTDYLIEVFSENMPPSDKKCVIFPKMNSYWKLIDKSTHLEIALSEIQETNPERCIIYSLHHTDILKNVGLTKKFDFPIAFSFKFMATYTPIDEDGHSVMEFSKLAGIATPNNPLLAVLRMDVDSLGWIFKDGLNHKMLKVDSSKYHGNDGKSIHSISRLATLSRELDMYFTKTVNLIAKEHNIYITYSGGDDLFAVGSWVKIIDFALEVRERFAHLCNQNPNISISAGTAISKPNFPIAKSAIKAGESESKAKNADITKKSGIKNKIELFDTIVYWEELEDKIKIAKDLIKAVEKGQGKSDDISPSFLYQLLVITRSCFDSNGSLNLNRMHRLTAKLHYHFARRKMTADEISKETNEIKLTLAKYFLKSTSEDKKRWYETFLLPASYVILKNRNIHKK